MKERMMTTNEGKMQQFLIENERAKGTDINVMCLQNTAGVALYLCKR